jgi:hypothetical protein
MVCSVAKDIAETLEMKDIVYENQALYYRHEASPNRVTEAEHSDVVSGFLEVTFVKVTLHLTTVAPLNQPEATVERWRSS